MARRPRTARISANKAAKARVRAYVVLGGSTPAPTPTPSPSPTPPASSSRTAEFGTNVGYVNYYGGDAFFIDRIKTANPAKAQDSSGNRLDADTGAITLDAKGYPKRLGAGIKAVYLIVETAQPGDLRPEARRFVLRTNIGTITAGVYSSVVNRVSPRRVVVDIAPNSPIGFTEILIDGLPSEEDFELRVQVCRLDQEALLDAGERFNPDYVQEVKDLGASFLRFMNFQNTNGSTLTRWADRTLPDEMSYTTGRGAPLEDVALLANLTGCDPWVHIPYKAMEDRTYVQSMMALLDGLLAPSLRIRLEATNEIFNSGVFPNFGYFDAIVKRDYPSMDWNGFHYAYYLVGLCAKEADAYFRGLGKRDRLRNIIGVQTFVPGLFEGTFAPAVNYAGGGVLPATGIDNLNDVFDQLAITRYINGLTAVGPGGYFVNDQTTRDRQQLLLDRGVKGGNFDLAWGDSQVRTGSDLGRADFALGGQNTLTAQWKAIVDTLGLDLVTYEGSVSDEVYESAKDNFGEATAKQMMDFIVAVTETGAYAENEMYDTLIQGVQNGVSATCHYKTIASPGGGLAGNFGLRRFTGQGVTPRTKGFARAVAAKLALPAVPTLALTHDASAGAAQDSSTPIKLKVRGGRGPYYVALKSGTLPPGRNLSGMRERGTFTTSGTYTRTYEVTDSSSPARKAEVTIETRVFVAPSGFRYWRLTPKNNKANQGLSNTYFRAGTSEVEFRLGTDTYNPAGWVATTTKPSSQDPIKRILDRATNASYISPEGPGAPVITIDVGAGNTISPDRIVIWDVPEADAFSINGVLVEKSNDGTNWQTAANPATMTYASRQAAIALS